MSEAHEPAPGTNDAAPPANAPRRLHRGVNGSGSASNRQRSLIQGGSLRLFRLGGIDVFLHWSWLIAAYLQIRYRAADESAKELAWYWPVLEYLALFGIVLMHEFGHALACRSVGGIANRIILWPLGGIAFVNPPPRPGAFLWSIAAGPLVNLILVPITLGLCILSLFAGWHDAAPALDRFLFIVAGINLLLLLFNLLPIYPLDGGQILQGVLWYFIGRAHSLLVVSVLGLVTSVIALAVLLGAQLLGTTTSLWMLILIASFATLMCLGGVHRAWALMKVFQAPCYEEYRCPGCKAAPPAGEFWTCTRCLCRYDTFAHGTVCPRCSRLPRTTMCPECYGSYPFADWGGTVASVQAAPQPQSQPLPVPPRLERTATQLSPGMRAVWALMVGGIVLAVGWAIAGRDHATTVLVLALGGAILGATGAEGLSRSMNAGRARGQLRGIWWLATLDGKALPGAGPEAVQMTIQGDGFLERMGDRVTAKGSYWLDPLKEPAWINVLPRTGPGAGKTYLGIYKLVGTALTMCVAEPGEPRPAEFVASPPQSHLLEYERE